MTLPINRDTLVIILYALGFLAAAMFIIFPEFCRKHHFNFQKLLWDLSDESQSPHPLWTYRLRGVGILLILLSGVVISKF